MKKKFDIPGRVESGQFQAEVAWEFNFRQQTLSDYINKVKIQAAHKMPTLKIHSKVLICLIKDSDSKLKEALRVKW